MTATTMPTFFSTHRSGLTLSVVAHALIMFALSTSVMFMPSPQTPMLAIEAVIVDSNAVPKAAEQKQPDKAADDQRRKEEQARKEREQQKQQAAEQRKQEQDKAEQARKQQETKAAEARKQADAKAESERKAQLKREADTRAKAEQQRKQAEAEAKAASERAAAEAKAREQSRRQADLIASMEAEEALAAAQQSGAMSRYIALIQQKVERNWVPPASAQTGLECEVLVQQLPNGDVVDARTVSCNGDSAVQRSIENAVRRSSPLPLPDNQALFERNLRFIFKPEQ